MTAEQIEQDYQGFRWNDEGVRKELDNAIVSNLAATLAGLLIDFRYDNYNGGPMVLSVFDPDGSCNSLVTASLESVMREFLDTRDCSEEEERESVMDVVREMRRVADMLETEAMTERF